MPSSKYSPGGSSPNRWKRNNTTARNRASRIAHKTIWYEGNLFLEGLASLVDGDVDDDMSIVFTLAHDSIGACRKSCDSATGTKYAGIPGRRQARGTPSLHPGAMLCGLMPVPPLRLWAVQHSLTDCVSFALVGRFAAREARHAFGSLFRKRNGGFQPIRSLQSQLNEEPFRLPDTDFDRWYQCFGIIDHQPQLVVAGREIRRQV